MSDLNCINVVNDIRLDNPNYVTEASWRAQTEDKCLTGTRCEVLLDVIEWCKDSSNSRVFWLNGMAGIGKSAIARTLCHQLHQAQLLGGGFFCSRRGSLERRDIKNIIPTLACQLAELDPEYKRNLVECLRQDPDISTDAVDRQIEQLLVRSCSDTIRSLSTPLIFVIDALDEGAEADETAWLLEVILERAEDIPFRFFLTGRPKSHILDRFHQPSSSRRTILQLHNVQESMIKADIELYITDRLYIIKDSHQKLPKKWPRADQVQKLAYQADNRFCYAFALCNYIASNPLPRLRIAIQITIDDQGQVIERHDDMYTLILNEAESLGDSRQDTISDIQKCLVAHIYAQERLSLLYLSELMSMEYEQAGIVMDILHPLIFIPESNDIPVTTLYASLCDYLNNETRSQHHAITKDAANWILLSRCLQVLSQDLCFNVSGATTSYLTNVQQQLKLPYMLVYSAANWAWHMAEITPSEELSATVIAWVKSTLIPKFLFWLEVMSVGRKIDMASKIMWKLLGLIEVCSPKVAASNDDCF
jgi:hypothetical protein